MLLWFLTCKNRLIISEQRYHIGTPHTYIPKKEKKKPGIEIENNSKRLTNKGLAITFVKHSQLLFDTFVSFFSLLLSFSVRRMKRYEKYTDFKGFSLLKQSVAIIVKGMPNHILYATIIIRFSCEFDGMPNCINFWFLINRWTNYICLKCLMNEQSTFLLCKTKKKKIRNEITFIINENPHRITTSSSYAYFWSSTSCTSEISKRIGRMFT